MRPAKLHTNNKLNKKIDVIGLFERLEHVRGTRSKHGEELNDFIFFKLGNFEFLY